MYHCRKGSTNCFTTLIRSSFSDTFSPEEPVSLPLYTSNVHTWWSVLTYVGEYKRACDGATTEDDGQDGDYNDQTVYYSRLFITENAWVCVCVCVCGGGGVIIYVAVHAHCSIQQDKTDIGNNNYLTLINPLTDIYGVHIRIVTSTHFSFHRHVHRQVAIFKVVLNGELGVCVCVGGRGRVMLCKFATGIFANGFYTFTDLPLCWIESTWVPWLQWGTQSWQWSWGWNLKSCIRKTNSAV